MAGERHGHGMLCVNRPLVALLFVASLGHWKVGWKDSVLAQGLSSHTDNSDNDGRARNTRSSIECFRHRNWLQLSTRWNQGAKLGLRQTRQLPRAVDLKGRLLSCQSY